LSSSFSQIDGFLVQFRNVFGYFFPVKSIPFFQVVKKVGIFGIMGGLLGTYDEGATDWLPQS
jgi:hypothetical protein